MSDAPKTCDVLVLIPKRDELRSAAAVFEFDSEVPESIIEDKYECWSSVLAGLRVLVMLADSQSSTKLALATRDAITALDPAVAFCIGTAAGREDEISYMDAVIATAVLDATEWRAKPGELRPQWEDPLKPSADVRHDVDLFVKSNLWHAAARDLLLAALRRLGSPVPPEVGTSWPTVQDAWIATSSFLHQDAKLLGQIWGLHGKLRAIDMETAGFVSACLGTARTRPWIVIRAVSDYGTVESKRDGARPAAGAAAATIAHAFISHGLKRAHPLRVAPAESMEPAISESNFFARMTISDFLAKELPTRFDVRLDDAVLRQELTIHDLAALCGHGDKTVEELDDIREEYFTTKYLDYDDEADVRRLTGSAWADEVMDIYEYLGIRLSNADVLYVGVSTGRDLPKVCPKFNTLTGVDLSTQMLERAARVQPKLRQVRSRAETLGAISDASVDLYLSLRTYQSSLFDIPSALRQAYRVLRADGSLVISIPGGFLDRSGPELRYIPGLLVPGSNEIVDKERPRRFAREILRQVDRMGFTRVGFHQREGDLYIYARRV